MYLFIVIHLSIYMYVCYIYIYNCLIFFLKHICMYGESYISGEYIYIYVCILSSLCIHTVLPTHLPYNIVYLGGSSAIQA